MATCQAREALLEKMYGPELMVAQRAFKAIWDPSGRMNPGKVIDAYPIASNLWMGSSYRPPKVRGHFAHPQDDGDFTKALERCIGVGACRRPETDEGVMCQRFMATREEKHSTRGRARRLFEMMHGGAINDRLEERGRRSSPRPPSRLQGQIQRWRASPGLPPGLVNAIPQTPVMASLVKALIGAAPQRRLPSFARRSFRTWCQRDRDTPSASLRCGRPLYDWGWIDQAKGLGRRTLAVLRPEIEVGVPIIGLEPAGVSAFRDELPNPFPDNPLARALRRQTLLLTEFLDREAPIPTCGPRRRCSLICIAIITLFSTRRPKRGC